MVLLCFITSIDGDALILIDIRQRHVKHKLAYLGNVEIPTSYRKRLSGNFIMTG